MSCNLIYMTFIVNKTWQPGGRHEQFGTLLSEHIENCQLSACLIKSSMILTDERSSIFA
jgi:hypothetical protein